MATKNHCKKKLFLLSIAFCLLFLKSTNADGSCKTGCPQSDNGLLKYTRGHVYEYSFDSILTVGVGSGELNEGDDTSLKVIGNAKVSAEGNCGFTLQLSSVKVVNIRESDEKKIQNSITKPVLFTIANGKVLPEICADPSESEQSLNIKRAVISLFQSNIDSDYEIDVFGNCPTNTIVTKHGNSDVITKTRNLNSCAYRERINSGLVTGVVNENAGLKSTHVFQADYTKEAKVGNGVIESAQLVESYKFAAAIKGNSNVHAKVVTNLKLKKSGASASAAPASGSLHGVSIIYQNTETATTKNIAALKSILFQLVELTGDYVKRSSAKQFVELIRLMRNANTDTLLELGTLPHPNKVLARKVYLDALFRVNTADSAKAIIKQLNKLDDKEKSVAIISMNVIEFVDKETVSQAAALLVSNAPKEIYLLVGNLVSKYCKQNSCSDSDIGPVLKKFTDNLKHCKANTKKEEERLIYILKGIGKTEHIATSAVAALVECASTGHSNRLRVAALQAFVAASCNTHLKEKALQVLKDHNEDSELRIEAYLAATRCPDANLANEIAEVVKNEKVYQVSGFIASNLRTIRDSTDAKYDQQRYFLGNIRVAPQFPKDYRRYSFNNEVSYKLESLGLSASSDFKLIYSQHGFLPRSAKLNVTTEIFGTNFNVLEASVRQENLENVLEYYIGPKGLLNKDFDELVNLIEAGNSAVTDTNRRSKRSVADAVKTAKKYKTYGNKNAQDLNLDLSLKLFGSELTFLSLDDKIPSSFDEVIKHFSLEFDKTKKELSSFGKEFVYHSLFLDTKFTYPTGVGVPLELSLQGFSANKLDFAINLDVDAVLKQNWQNSQYRLKIIPSIDVNLNIQLGFNAIVLATGVRVDSNAHSAGGSDITVTLTNNGNGFNADIELPRERLDLIDVDVNVELYVADRETPLKSVALKGADKQKLTPNKNCFNQLEILGLNVCFESTSNSKSESGSDELQILQPFSFSLYAITERKYSFKATHVPQSSTGTQQWKLDFSTPGSSVSHDTLLVFEIGKTPSIFSRFSFANPQINFAFEAGLTNDNREIVLYGQYEQNNDVKKSKIGFTKNNNEYRPIIEIHEKNDIKNQIFGYRMDGRVIVQKNKEKQDRYQFDNFQLINPEKEAIVLNGWADLGSTLFATELHVTCNQITYLVKSNFKIENSNYEAGFFINNERSPDKVYGGSARLAVAGSAFNLILVGKASTWSVESASDFEYAKSETSNKVSNHKFSQDLKINQNGQSIGSLKLKSVSDPNNLELHVEVTRDKKVASTKIVFQTNRHVENDFQLEVNARLNKHFVDILSKCDVKGTVFLIDNVLKTSWGTELTAKGELGQRYSSHDIHIDLQGSAQYSSKDKPTQWILKVIGSPDKTTSEFRLSRDNAELVKFTGETQHPQDKISAGSINLVVKNVVTAKGEFKHAKNGKGEITGTIETQKTEPKHKIEIDSKFYLQAPKYNVDTTITFDSDKKIVFKTDNNLDKAKLSTKNVIEIDNKKLSFDATGNVKGEWRSNGEIQGNFVLTLPDNRVVDGNIKRKVNINAKTGLTHGNLDIQIGEQDPSTGKKRSASVNGKLERFNAKSKELVVSNQLSYTDYDNRKLDVNYHIKHLVKTPGQTYSIDFGSSVGGNLLNEPIEISFVLDEYNADHAAGHVSLKHGSSFSTNFDGNYNVGGQGTPASFELQGSLQVPDSTFKTFELSTQGKFLRPNSATEDTYLVDLHFTQKSGQSQFVRYNNNWKGSLQQGSYSFDVETNSMKGPLKVDGTYQRSNSGSQKDVKTSGNQKYVFNWYWADKYLKSTTDFSFTGLDTATLRLNLDSSFDSVKNIDIDLSSVKSTEDTHVTTVKVNQNGKAYSLDSKVYTGTHKKGLDIRAKLPSGEPIVIIGVLDILGERKTLLSISIENLGDLDFTINADSAFTTINDFYILVDWNSRKLKLDDYKFEIRAHNESINIQLKNASSVVFAGTVAYAFKKEKNKLIIDGQGQLTVNGKLQNSNFKLTRQIYDLVNDKEVGFSYTFNGNFGSKNGVSTVKITNKDFNVKLSICEEKKQCTNVQVQSIITADEQQLGKIEHSVLVLVDLRELGYPHEFELQAKSTRQGFKYHYYLNTNVVSNTNHKYQLIAKILPTSSTVQLKLPKREIQFDAVQQVPPQIFGHYEYSTAFYIDKVNKPNDKTQFVAEVDLSGTKQTSLNGRGQLKFEHPTVRPLTISGTVNANRDQNVVNAEFVFDIFRAPDQKIIVTTELNNKRNDHGFDLTANQKIRSTGLQLHYEIEGHTTLNTDIPEFSASSRVQSDSNDFKADINVFGNKEHFYVTAHESNEEILRLDGEYNKQSHVAKLTAKLQSFGLTPLELTTQIQPTLTKVSVKREGLFNANAELKIGKAIEFSADGDGKQLLNGRIALDGGNFLQTTYKSNDEDVQAFINSFETQLKKEADKTQTLIQQRFDKLSHGLTQQLHLAKETIPDFDPLKASYNENFNAIIKELESDPLLSQIFEVIRTFLGKITKIIDDFTNVAADSYKKLHANFVELSEKVQTIVRETLLPAWKKIVVSATKIISDIRVEVFKIYSKTLQYILSSLEKYGPALKNYGKLVNESIKPFTEAAQEVSKFVYTAVEEVLVELQEYKSKLPTFEALRTQLTEKLKKLKLVEKALEVINQIFAQLHILPQTPEITEFLQKVHEYLEATLREQPLNGEQVFEELYSAFVKALRSVAIAIQTNTRDTPVSKLTADYHSWFSSLTHFFEVVTKLPVLFSFRFSLINYLLNENWENVISNELFKSWVFFNDFELRGHIADGHHVFTFDGQYFSYPGNCKYILVQDSVDNNFTVFAQLNNGKLKTISLADRDGNYVEVSEAGALKFNGEAVEYPQHKAGVHAWRLIYTVHLLSEYGVNVICTSDLKVCHVHVNGFYNSKTRGLLGNGNNEPYDDYLQIDGTLAADSASFGNGYGLGKCAPVAFESTQVEAETQADVCNDIFGLDSPLALNFLTLNSSPYRKACHIAVQKAAEKDKEQAACNIALAYASALKSQNKLVLLPNRCLKCPGNAGQREIGDEFTVKLPNKQADVVFVVDVNVTPTVLGQLVAPVITEIRDTLKSRGFTDVQVGVVAYNESQWYPALLTSNNGKINYQGNVANLELNGPKSSYDNIVSHIITEKHLQEIYDYLERIIKNVVPQSDELAFNLALNYPFRSGAAKTIVGVRSDSLEYGNLSKFIRTHISGSISNFGGALLQLLTPVKDLHLEGVPAEKLVGFNSRLVATVDGKDNKKRSKLQFQNDMGIDFVLNNGGWVFATQNFDNLKPQDQKKTVNQITSSIADTLFKTEITSECQCKQVHGLHAQHKCVTKSSNFIPNKKLKSA